MKELSPYYRADLDGLRGIGLIIVVLFHFQFFGDRVYIGALGLDIFFILSGYLLTSIILREIASDTFRFANFWERRIRRILPALFVVTMLATIYASVQFESISKALPHHADIVFTQSFFMTNYVVLSQHEHTGGGVLKVIREPLEHTWSLSVEEQFYLLLPIVVAFGLLYLSRSITVFVIGTLTLLSLKFYLEMQLNPTGTFHFFGFETLNAYAAYYLMPAKAWEILAGVLVAFIAAKPGRVAAEILSAIGLAFLIGAIVFSEQLRFERAVPLLISGVALMIFGGRDFVTKSRQILSFKPLVQLGLISYSFYLWHWVFYVFATRQNPSLETDVTARILVIVLCGCVAKASYEFIEKPFLRKNYYPVKDVYIYGTLALIIMTCTGLLLQ